MSTEQTIDSNHDSAEVCIRRLSRKLSEVEIVMATQEGKANQMKKERDAEKSENEQLKKEVRRLNNELLKEKTISAALIKRNCKQENDKEITDGKQENGEDDFVPSQTRRGSLPVSSLWKPFQRRGFQDFPKDLRNLLDRRSNELLQQKQQYRIFEHRFKQQADRCIKMDSDLERLDQLLVELLGLHAKCHGCSIFQHNKIVILGKKIELHCTKLIMSCIAMVLVVLYIFFS